MTHIKFIPQMFTKSLAMVVGLSCYAMAFTGQIALAAGVDASQQFHHNIHNFFFNESDKTKPNYLAIYKHGLAMSYDATTHYLAKTLGSDVDPLKRILLHNAYYIPATIDFQNHRVKYTVSYMDASKKSTVNPSRIVWEFYPLNTTDIDILKGYGCALSADYQKVTINSSLADATNLFRIDKDYGRVVANWQSKYVVDDLVNKTIITLKTGIYDYLFIDDLIRNPGDCVNKEFGNKGSYVSWKEGQLDFLIKLTNAAHALKGRLGLPIKVLGNIWSPYADTDAAKWYSNSNLRLDHYYFESAGTAAADLLNGQSTNGRDPETGLNAYIPYTGGFIPAKSVSVQTNLKTMYSLAAGKTELAADYMLQHYKAAGTAASQGSWFGWYGEASVDKTYPSGALIHNNAMQLLRALPDWENLAQVPLASRKYDKTANTYASPNSKFSNNVIQGLNPVNNEIYVVFRNTTEPVDLLGKTLVSANFVDDYFTKTTTSAVSCLTAASGKLSLKCADKIEKGIRLTVK